EPSTTQCRASSGASCDPPEYCTGSSGQTCPADVMNASATVGFTVTLTHDIPSSTTTISWTEVMPGPFNVYRGTRVSGSWMYNQTCLAEGLPGPDTTGTGFPSFGQTYFYLVTRKTVGCLESSLGQDSNGGERP